MGVLEQIKAQQLANPKSGALTSFSPGKTKAKDVKLDAVIAAAKRLQDWPLLEEAVDQKMGEQEEFVGWWRANVRGKGEKANSAGRGYFVNDTEAQTGITHQQVSKWAKRLGDKAKYRADLYGAAWRKAMSGAGDHRVTLNTGENEWYTPDEYLDLARQVLGDFDLDPASTPLANERVRATEIFTEADDGLKQPWQGRVWMNPPYAQPLIADFADKLVDEFEAGTVTGAIVLTNDSTDTGWFHRLANGCAALCFTRGRIRFVSPRGDSGTPTQGQAFFYFGSDLDIFADVFGAIGFVAVPRGSGGSEVA